MGLGIGIGIGIGEPQLDLGRIMAFKDEGVDGNVKGVELLLRVCFGIHSARARRRVRSMSEAA